MEFHQIRYFLAVCDEMNFTKAAEVCHVSQPALSKAIQKLEAELGGSLFVREGGRQLALTELGRVMRTHLAGIEETRTSARRAARAVTGRETAELNVGVMCTIGPRMLGPAVAAFQARNPSVSLILHDVWSKRGHDLLLSGAIDCALLARHHPLPNRLQGVALYREPMCLAMEHAHALAARPAVAIGDLDGCNYVDRLRCEFRDEFMDQLDERSFGVNIVMRSEREDWIQIAVASGHGLSMMPKYSVMTEGIVTRPLEGLVLERTVEVVTVQGRPDLPGLADFISFMRDYRWPEAEAPAAPAAQPAA